MGTSAPSRPSPKTARETWASRGIWCRSAGAAAPSMTSWRGSMTTTAPVARTRCSTATRKTAETSPMARRVWEAPRARGRRKNRAELDTDSTPVRPTAPEEKARSTSRASPAPVTTDSTCRPGWMP